MNISLNLKRREKMLKEYLSLIIAIISLVIAIIALIYSFK